jgi:hypothetical protein
MVALGRDQARRASAPLPELSSRLARRHTPGPPRQPANARDARAGQAGRGSHSAATSSNRNPTPPGHLTCYPREQRA